MMLLNYLELVSFACQLISWFMYWSIIMVSFLTQSYLFSLTPLYYLGIINVVSAYLFGFCQTFSGRFRDHDSDDQRTIINKYHARSALMFGSWLDGVWVPILQNLLSYPLTCFLISLTTSFLSLILKIYSWEIIHPENYTHKKRPHHT